MVKVCQNELTTDVLEGEYTEMFSYMCVCVCVCVCVCKPMYVFLFGT